MAIICFILHYIDKIQKLFIFTIVFYLNNQYNYFGMKPTLRKSLPQPEHSFVLRKDTGRNIRTDWHYHPDYELVCIKRSRGTWLIGDYNGPFESGDVILIGPNLPHSYRHEEEYLRDQCEKPGEVIAVLFLKEILGNPFFALPETTGIKDVLDLSNRGLRLTGQARFHAGMILNSLLYVSPGRRLVDLLYILQLMADSNEFEILASSGFTYHSSNIDNARISAVIEYTFNNFHTSISVEEVAALIHMSKHSFSRFFKDKTRKNYTQFLMEVRIGKACRLLIEEDMSIREVSYSCGYNSISHFNHQFKATKNKSPYEYKQEFDKHLPVI